MRKLRKTSWAPGVVLLAAITGGCDKRETKTEPSAPGAAAASPDARKEAQEIFTTRCTMCHGASGAGDGAASSALNPRPRNYQDKAWQASVTNEQIEKIIVAGGAAVGKSAMMPPNPDLQSKPQVVAALREIVRGFGK